RARSPQRISARFTVPQRWIHARAALWSQYSRAAIDEKGEMVEPRDRERHQGERTPRYRSWLLRCWTGKGVGDPAGSAGRYSLEDPHTGARRVFTSLADLVAYLRVAQEA